jgi:hypothetical protein
MKKQFSVFENCQIKRSLIDCPEHSSGLAWGRKEKIVSPPALKLCKQPKSVIFGQWRTPPWGISLLEVFDIDSQKQPQVGGKGV